MIGAFNRLSQQAVNAKWRMLICSPAKEVLRGTS